MGMEAVVLSLILILSKVGESDGKAVTIDAAYTTRHLLNLIVDKELMFVDKEMKMEINVQDMTSPPALAKLPIQAAATTFDQSVRDVFFYGPNRGLFVEFTNLDNVRDLIYDTSHPLFANGGPDATAKKGEDMYIFKGDKMAIRTGPEIFGDPMTLPKGMPGDLDAAWNDGEDMIVLKGDKIWTWKSDGRVSSSSNFHDVYSVRSWTLKSKD